jgi:hypothetical protein
MPITQRQQDERDHTVTVIVGTVALFGLVVALAIGLEVSKSPNSLAILGMIFTTGVLVVVPQLFNMRKTDQAVKGVGELKGQLNGDLDDRIERAAARAVRTVMTQREEGIDDQIREIARDVVSEEIDRLIGSCEGERE